MQQGAIQAIITAVAETAMDHAEGHHLGDDNAAAPAVYVKLAEKYSAEVADAVKSIHTAHNLAAIITHGTAAIYVCYNG